MTSIVVGVDGSAPGRAALEWALTEARLRGCEVLAEDGHDIPVRRRVVEGDAGAELVRIAGPDDLVVVVRGGTP